MDLTILAPDLLLLVCAVVCDGLVGDPIYALHPIRLVGATLSFFERVLRSLRLDGYVGGCVLFCVLAAFWVGLICALAIALYRVHVEIGWLFHAFVLYSLIALKDLCKHGLAIDRAADLDGARQATAMLVGRDIERMDVAACRRAGMESLSENAVDGFIAPIFYYALLGLPGLVLFKVISTMDSMVGFKTPRYRYFGWCGARLDDVLNFLPARLTYVLMIVVAFFFAALFGAQGSCGWVAAARARSGTKFWVERSNRGRRATEAVGWSYLAGRDADYRLVVGR